MQKNRKAQEESLRRREELIQELELEREIRCRERKQEEGRRTARMQEIDAQVSTLCSVLGYSSSFFLQQLCHNGSLFVYILDLNVLCVYTAGGTEAPGAVEGAAQDGAGGGGGQGGSSNPGGGAEFGDAEDGQERVPGEGKWSYRKQMIPNVHTPSFEVFFDVKTCSLSDSQQTSISVDVSNLQD